MKVNSAVAESEGIVPRGTKALVPITQEKKYSFKKIVLYFSLLAVLLHVKLCKDIANVGCLTAAELPVSWTISKMF